MKVEKYCWNKKRYVIVDDKDKNKKPIIHQGYMGIELDLNYIKDKFNTYPLSEGVIVFYTKEGAEKCIKYLEPLLEPYIVMEKLLGG